MPTKTVWKAIQTAADEVGMHDLEVISERKHLIVEMTTPHGVRRRASFSITPSDRQFANVVKRQLKRLAQEEP